MAHSRSHTHPHHHHHHDPAVPHPAQPAPWSILRMTLPARLGLALLVSAAMWAFVFVAMR
jgi:hypothetical protein